MAHDDFIPSDDFPEEIDFVKTIGEFSKENIKLNGILVDIIGELSIIYPRHEIETIPAKVKEVVQRLVKAEKDLEALRKT